MRLENKSSDLLLYNLTLKMRKQLQLGNKKCKTKLLESGPNSNFFHERSFFFFLMEQLGRTEVLDNKRAIVR